MKIWGPSIPGTHRTKLLCKFAQTLSFPPPPRKRVWFMRLIYLVQLCVYMLISSSMVGLPMSPPLSIPLLFSSPPLPLFLLPSSPLSSSRKEILKKERGGREEGRDKDKGRRDIREEGMRGKRIRGGLPPSHYYLPLCKMILNRAFLPWRQWSGQKP